MCGQIGIVFGRRNRSPEEFNNLCQIFTQMLLCCEKRGVHASGLAWFKTNGRRGLFKKPLAAREFVQTKPYQKMLAQVDQNTTVLMGHTRWRTIGSEFNNHNNHPIKAGKIIGTHNGTIYNADQLFQQFSLLRRGDVDSELIFRLADFHSPDGTINLEALKDSLSQCCGQMSVILASQVNPENIIIMKGNKPLCVRYHLRYHILLYASEASFIDESLTDDSWQELEIQPMTALVVNSNNLPSYRASTFYFTPRYIEGTLPPGVDV